MTNNLTQQQQEQKNMHPFDDIKYICNSTSLITSSLQKGFDVAQLSNGDIVVREIIAVNVQYHWDSTKQKMVKVKSA
jgi:hypothetical protein